MPEPQTHSDVPDGWEVVAHAAPTGTAAPSGSAGARFAEGAWKNLNPMNLVTAASHPIDTLGALIDAQLDQFTKAKSMYDEGRYSEAVGHLGGGLLPLLGPPAANAGERIGSGDIAGGLGEATGVLAAAEAPRAIAKGSSAVAARVAPVVSRLPTDIAADVTGLVSPRMAHGLRLLKKIADKFGADEAAPAERPPTAAAPTPAAPPSAAPTPAAAPAAPLAPYEQAIADAKRAGAAQPAASTAEPARSVPQPAGPPRPDPNPVIQKIVDAMKAEGLSESEVQQAYRWIAQGVEPKVVWQRIQNARALQKTGPFAKLPTNAETEAAVSDRNAKGRWPEE